MSDNSTDPDESDGACIEPEGMPLWVKVFGIIILAVVLVFVVVLLAGGNHGPGRHSSGGTGVTSRAAEDPDKVFTSGHWAQRP